MTANPRFKGKKHTVEWRAQMSLRMKGNTFAKAGEGRKLSEEHRTKLSLSAKKRVAEGRHNNYKGGQPNCLDCGIKLVSYTAKRCKKCRTKLDLSGENHWAWRGGISSLNRRIRSSNDYLSWRKNVLQRDNYTCVLCGDRNFRGRGRTVVLQADHIKSFAYFPELRFDISNGRTLCIDCHRQTDTWGKQKNLRHMRS